MTINKAHGQTLQRVGVLLDEPVSTHYTSRNGVAVTQATSDFCTEPTDCWLVWFIVFSATAYLVCV